MFSTNEPFVIRLLSGGEKIAKVRFPTDQEWIDNTSRKRSIRRKGGRGGLAWEDLGDHRKLDLDLLGAIAIEGADNFDEYEAEAAIVRLARADVVDVERDGDNFHVQMEVYGKSLVTHTLRMPSERQKAEHEKSTADIKRTPKGEVLEFSLQGSVELWAVLHLDTDGYAEGSQIPVIHKSNAIGAVIQHLKELETLDPES